MRRGLPLVVWAAVWAVVVAVSATSVWAAISRAGARTNQAAPQLPVSRVTYTPRPTPSDVPTGSAGPVARQGSWSGSAGRVTATCRGQRIGLDAAVPADGFTIEIENRGPVALEVEFKQARADREYKVRAVCRAAAPVFAVEQE
ncbi:MAG: hypothetical protein IT193_07785 [Propionibacteriaceae bacterium]|nr:hypothetical protein [Propionibacteriaceae bacterium]